MLNVRPTDINQNEIKSKFYEKEASANCKSSLFNNEWFQKRMNISVLFLGYRAQNERWEKATKKQSVTAQQRVTIAWLYKDNDVTPSSPDLAASVDMVRTTWITSHLESFRICSNKQTSKQTNNQLLTNSKENLCCQRISQKRHRDGVP